MLRLQSQWFMHSFICQSPRLRSSPKKWGKNIRSLSMEAHTDIMGCGMVPQRDCLQHCYHYMQPSAWYLTPWLGETRAPLASVCCSNPQQGILSTCYHLPRDPGYKSTEQWGTDEKLDLWEASEQILWYIFLATETSVFYIQFLQNSIQYTTNNFPNTTQQFLAQADCFSKSCCSPALKLTQSPIQKLLLALTPATNFLEVTVLRFSICEVLMSCLNRNNLHFIQEISMTESIMEALRIRTPCLFVFLALQPFVVVFSQPSSGL
jgi:hypothetical protein